MKAFEGTEQEGAWSSFAGHLMPGVVGVLAFFSFAWLIKDSGLPPIVAMLFTTVFVLLPLELWLIFRSRRHAGGVLMISRMARTKYWPVYFSTAVGAALLLPGLAVHMESFLGARTLTWFPPWAQIYDMHRVALMSKASRWALIAGIFLIFGVVGPIVEELYFRAHLFPRVMRWGWVSAVWSASMFAVYHFWQPWTIPTVFLSFLIPCFVVLRTHNAAFSMGSHILTNLLRLSLLLSPLLAF